MASRPGKEETEKIWRERIISCRTSGLSVSEWCKNNNVGQATYYRYLRHFREQLLEKAETECVPVTFEKINLTEVQNEITTFSEEDQVSSHSEAMTSLCVDLPEKMYQPTIVVRIGSFSAEIPDDVRKDTMEAVLHALKQLC